MASKMSRPGYVLVVTPWITVKGKRIYPKNGRFFAFWVPADKYRR